MLPSLFGSYYKTLEPIKNKQVVLLCLVAHALLGKPDRL